MATAGNDLLLGTDGADTIDGLAGDDAIFGHKSATTSPFAGEIDLVRVGTGFTGAVTALSAPNDPNHLYVVQKDTGQIRILDPATGQSTLFLDIPDSDLTRGGEQGLLGLAFHPNYAANGRFFVHVVNADGDVEVREYQRTGANQADAATKEVIITVPHPTFTNHNGGSVAFGPDGFLYVSIGDGGSGNDPFGNAQNKNSLLGKILRLDVDNDAFPGDPARNYANPNTNPFVGQAGADEIWAYGLRNPFRVTFDAVTGDLYIGDVGQSAREEIDFQPAGIGGRNYGWDVMEGTLGPQQPGFVLPIFDYGRTLGTTVTGGYVYRGPHAGFDGSYFFTDFGSGRIWTLKVVNGEATSIIQRTEQFTSSADLVSSFGVDGAGNLYLVSLLGDIYRIDPSSLAGDVGDRLLGGAGDDRIFGGAGPDSLFGGTDNDQLSGGFGNDRLDGQSGIDTMRGGQGNDTYLVNTALDVVIESRGAGIDRIIATSGFKLGSGVENLTLVGDADSSGTGNGLANLITGNGAANVLIGNSGDDTIRGGNGKDRLDGDAGNDHLDGGNNVDIMRGGAGNDTYVANSVADRAIESSGAGTDRVISTATFMLGSNVENLALTGTAGIRGIGNSLDNLITGNNAANLLNGGAGDDTLVGRSGNDTFAFNTALNAATNVDRVTDFSVVGDTIQLENAVFRGLVAGTLASSAFFRGAAAHDTDDRVIYNSANGALLFDADGSGAGAAIQFAVLTRGLALTNADFMVV
ncbi:MAG: PQQ-dependent sugar dehydrogenase [Xanthobacteraceae bacterium]